MRLGWCLMNEIIGHLSRVIGFGLFLFLVVVAGTGLAQTTGSGTINGTLRDPSQGAIPSATVTIHNSDTGIDRTLVTTDTGVYSAPFLPPGNYQITAAKTGFTTIFTKDITLQVGQTRTIDLELPVQARAEEVTVTGVVPIVDSEKTEISQVVSETQQTNLPLAGRRWENFALLTPNTTTDGGTGLVSYRESRRYTTPAPSMGQTTIRLSFPNRKAAPLQVCPMCTAWIRFANSR